MRRFRRFERALSNEAQTRSPLCDGLPGEPHPIENPVWLDKIVDVISDGPGIWYPLVKRGTYIESGMELGYITDYFGKVILEERAPVAGVVLHLNAVPSLKKGDNIANIGVVAAHAP